MRPCFFILKCKTKYIAFDALAWYTFIRTKSNRCKEEHYIMNERELREIKRRFNPDKSNISAIKGCLVNEKREIVTKFSQSVALSGAEETEELLSVMKKVLTGSLGANLIDIAFDTDDTINGDEHGLLTALKTSGLCDENALDEFYHRAAEVIHIDGNFVILLANDKYDVFNYSGDGQREEESSSTYNYIVCAICPIKLTKPALSFQSYDNAFHTLAANSVVSRPENGFLFPAFDDRRENIYNALFYTRDITADNTEFVSRIFKSKPPMPAAVQKQTFGSCLAETVAEECDFEVLKSVHSQINEMIEEHKNTKDSEPLVMTKETLKDVLLSGGVSEEKVEKFGEKFEEEFGANTPLPPKNLINTKKFELTLPDVTINVNPERSDLITTQVINGVEYILIRAQEGVEVNGVNINIK